MTTSVEIYKHRQTGWMIFGTLGGVLLIIVLPNLLLLPESDLVWLSISAVPLVILGGLFSSLTVRVTEDAVEWWFGPGWWTYTLPLAEIKKVHVTNSSAWEGWGIRYTTKGRLYNVSGFQAVNIKKTDGTCLRIGSDEPECLKEAIERGLGSGSV